MKNYLTILMVFFTICSFAQPSGDIEKDTALGNQYYAEALELIERNDTSYQIGDLLQKANELHEAHPFDEKLVEIKGTLGYWLAKQEHFEAAKIAAQSAIDLAQQHNLKTNHPLLKNAFAAMQTIYLNGDYQISAAYGLKAMACSKKEEADYFILAEGLLFTYIYGVEQEKAILLLTDLEQQLTNLNDSTLNKYWVMIYRGYMQYNLVTRNYEKMIIYGHKLFAENEKYKKYSQYTISPIYVEMGHAYAGLGNFDEGIKSMNKGLKNVISEVGKDHSVVGTYYFNLAIVYKNKGDFPAAIQNYEQAINLLLKDKETFKVNLRIAYSNLAAIYQSLGELEEAEKQIKESQKYGTSYGTNLTLGNILGLQGKYEESLIVLQKALISVCTNFKNTDINQSPSPYEVYTSDNWAKYILDSKSEFLYRWGKEKNDTILVNQAIQIKKTTVLLNQKKMYELRGFERSQISNYLQLLFSLSSLSIMSQASYKINPSDKTFNQILETIEKQKAIQLIETLSTSTLPDDLFLKEQQIIQSIEAYGLQLDLAEMRQQKDSILYYRNQLFDANKLLETHFKDIEKTYPKTSHYAHHTKYATFTDIQKILSKNDLLLSYSLDSKKGSIVVINQLDKKIIQTDIANLSANIQKLNELIQDRFAFQTSVRDEFIDVSHELYKTLIEPIESELEGKTKLMIVVEGQLFHLPFELLLKSDEKKPYNELDFLIKKYEVNYHYSATAFLKLQEKATVKDNSLLAFAPVFTKGEELTEATRSLDFMIDSLYNGIDGNEFIALPSTKKEVNTIAKIVKSNNGQANILLQKNATKTNFAQQLEKQSYQFIHIATHGLVNFRNPKLSALACYSKDETMDNLMYANEIQFKNINADLVVLSSCESGIGQLVAGEGLIALNRSFIYSGAKNVMFSLWKVSDKYSSELMIDFYESYYETESYTAALRNAKLKLLENPTTAQPKFWAAFVLMGE